jgi:hypothetical protein
MKIIKNEKLITRNGKIGQWTSLAALVVLGLGMYISFSRPELFTYSVVCLVIGFIMTQVGMYMGNRWGRSPRPDEKIDAGLKGLHSEFNMYHYSSPVSHLLVGPSGAWVLIPYHQRGQVTYAKNRWKMSGGGFMQQYMRIFGQESIGRPEIDAENEVQTLNKFFAKKLDGTFTPEVKPILVFTSDEVEIDAGDSPIPALKLKQLKEFMRQGAKNRVLTSSQIEEIASLFDAS